MSLIVADRVKETTTTTGTGTISLAGAVAQFQSFASAVGNGNTCYYCIVSGDGTNWETGIGTVTTGSPNTLARTSILASSNSGSAISLSGMSTVYLTAPAATTPSDRQWVLNPASTTTSVLGVSAYMDATTFTPAEGDAYRFRMTFNRASSSEDDALLVVASGGANGYLLRFQSDGNIVPYSHSGGADAILGFANASKNYSSSFSFQRQGPGVIEFEVIFSASYNWFCPISLGGVFPDQDNLVNFIGSTFSVGAQAAARANVGKIVITELS